MGKGQERPVIASARDRREEIQGSIQLSTTHAVAYTNNRMGHVILLLVDEIHKVSRMVGPTCYYRSMADAIRHGGHSRSFPRIFSLRTPE